MNNDIRLTIVYRSPAEVRPDPRNPRTHSKKQVGEISASIVAFDFTNPILIDEAKMIIAGHGRLQAAKKLDLAQVPTITLPHLNDAQKRALRLADNKIALNAGWDTDLIKVELDELSRLELDFPLEITGFSTGEIDVILCKCDGDPDDEIVPAIPSVPRTKLGDIWVLGDHRIGCGDNRDLEFLHAVVGAEAKVDAAFLDPPYNVRINGHANTSGRHAEFVMASGEMTASEFESFLEQTLGMAVQVSRNGAVHFVCMDWRHLTPMLGVGSRIFGALINVCVWNKSNAGMGSLYRSKHELVLVFRVGEAPHVNAVELGKHGRNRTNVRDYASVNSLQGSRREDLLLHPTVKPVSMVAEAIKDVTRRGDIVLDTFLGSGTTLIAAERTGRRFRGVEIDPGYVDVAVDRWVAVTGGQPRLECLHRDAA
jgi:hypothetical protein